jgi:drug/metabolite transporter (DMT)-like permease
VAPLLDVGGSYTAALMSDAMTAPAPTARSAARANAVAVACLVFNALVWGVSWAPFRWLEQRGLHALAATALIYALAVLVLTLWRPQAWVEVARHKALWVLVIASGTTNAAFNWAVTIGDVVRVVLLFYLMPLWAVLLARAVLGERLTGPALLRVALALAGALIILWPPASATGAGWSALPLPRSLPDILGLIGGFSFALNNVVLRHQAQRSEQARALAMFVGGTAISAMLVAALRVSAGADTPALWPAAIGVWVPAVLALGLLFLSSNWALQIGAARLPANVTAVVMLTEVLFASVSAIALGAGTLTLQVMAGGAAIVAAALLAARQ